jgi:hypothetical protein
LRGRGLTPQNPFNWHPYRKYLIALVGVVITALTAANVTSIAIMTTWGPDWFGVSREGFVLSLTIVMIPISFTPMVLAPLSETVGPDPGRRLVSHRSIQTDHIGQYGRNMIYQITSLM